jgi:hypothetical protein
MMTMMKIARVLWLFSITSINVMPVMAGCPVIAIFSTKTTPPTLLDSFDCAGSSDPFSIANDGPFAMEYTGYDHIGSDFKSIFFILMGPNGMHRTHCENKSPYFLHGNQNGGKETSDPEEYGTVNGWSNPTIGEYTLFAVVYAFPNCKGSFASSDYSISPYFIIES